MEAALHDVARAFGLVISGSTPCPFGSGLIHTTWRIETTCGPHLLQRINSSVFLDPIVVAENAAAAAARVNDALHRAGDHDPRHRLVFADGPQGRPWFKTATGDVWRACIFVPDARPADPSRPEEIFAAARALGRFPGLIAHGSGPAPQGSIPGFHDTSARLAAFRHAVATDSQRRLAVCRNETEHLVHLATLAHRLLTENRQTRLVHGDAKLDNVLVDAKTGKVLCVIDLDTVMPGLAAHDFGDLVRSAITGRPEDEPDLQLITVGETVFSNLATAYLEGAAPWIEGHETDRLVDGAIVITFEQALRFLTDYLAGDAYYPVDDDEHNLRRARAQLRLLDELLAAENDLRGIIDGI